MYTNVSDEFKEIVKSNSVTAVAKLVFTNPNITIYGHSTEDLQSSLQDITITDNCYSGGNLIGTAMTKEVEVKIINKDNLDLADKEFELFVGVKLANGEYEYIPYGKYITTKYEDTKSNSIFKLIAYDYMNKLNKLFKDITFNPTFPITLKDFKEQLLNACSIEYEEQTLANDNFVVSVMPNFDGMSVRSVIGKIAELQGTFAKINRNNKMEFYLKTVTDEQIDAMSMNSSLEINKKYGVVNSVSLALGGVEGENVTLQDDESIAQNGETMITITDNPFVYTQELRENAITELFNSLNGFYYVPTKFKYKARLYTDCGDSIQVENVQDGTYVESMILNQTIKIPSTRQSQIESLALSDTAIENKYISQTEQKNTHTELMVDKVNQKITSVVEQIGDRSSKTTTITQDIDGIQSMVQDVENLTKTLEGTTSLFLENSINLGKVAELHIYGNNQVFDALILGNDVILGNTTILGGDSIIVITDKDNNSVEYDLGIREVLRQNGDVFDEYVLINDTAKVIRRINKDGTIKENPTEEILTAPTLVLLEGDNTISIKSYQANLKVTYVPKNSFTDTFTTTLQMNSAITQTAQEIKLEVSETYDGAEIVSRINQTAEQVNIDANKINLNGAVTANDKFKINLDGSVETTDLRLATGGKVIGGDGLMTNFQYNFGSNNISGYNISGFGDLGFVCIMETTNQKTSMIADIYIPENFKVIDARIVFSHCPIYYNDIKKYGYVKNVTAYIADTSRMENMYLKVDSVYGTDVFALNDNISYEEIDEAFENGSYTPPTPSSSSQKLTTIIGNNIKDLFRESGNYRVKLQSANNPPTTITPSACATETGYCKATINIIGYMSYEEEE